jgi:hypothetical protein
MTDSVFVPVWRDQSGQRSSPAGGDDGGGDDPDGNGMSEGEDGAVEGEGDEGEGGENKTAKTRDPAKTTRVTARALVAESNFFRVTARPSGQLWQVRALGPSPPTQTRLHGGKLVCTGANARDTRRLTIGARACGRAILLGAQHEPFSVDKYYRIENYAPGTPLHQRWPYYGDYAGAVPAHAASGYLADGQCAATTALWRDARLVQTETNHAAVTRFFGGTSDGGERDASAGNDDKDDDGDDEDEKDGGQKKPSTVAVNPGAVPQTDKPTDLVDRSFVFDYAYGADRVVVFRKALPATGQRSSPAEGGGGNKKDQGKRALRQPEVHRATLPDGSLFVLGPRDSAATTRQVVAADALRVSVAFRATKTFKTASGMKALVRRSGGGGAKGGGGGASPSRSPSTVKKKTKKKAPAKKKRAPTKKKKAAVAAAARVTVAIEEDESTDSDAKSQRGDDGGGSDDDEEEEEEEEEEGDDPIEEFEDDAKKSGGQRSGPTGGGQRSGPTGGGDSLAKLGAAPMVSLKSVAPPPPPPPPPIVSSTLSASSSASTSGSVATKTSTTAAAATATATAAVGEKSADSDRDSDSDGDEEDGDEDDDPVDESQD